MSNLLNEKFSTRAKSAMLSAQRVSQELGHPHVGTEHLLYGIISEISSFASEVLFKNRINLEAVKLELLRINHSYISPKTWQPQMSANLRAVLEKAAVAAAKYQYQFIGTEHFLFGIVEHAPEAHQSGAGNRAQKVLLNLNINPLEIRKNLIHIFENVSKFPDAEAKHGAVRPKEFDSETATSPALEYFTTDLTKQAKAGKIDPLIGRGKEVQRLVSILNRRTKNNPVLIGEPGVGKTAIVEGLALAIHKRQVPDSLISKRILCLDLALIVAGSMFRGEFENRLKQIIEEVRDSPDIILFIDELHTVVGAGATTGSLDAANILKPALARGELRAIGATTLSEYKKHIEQDPALERRFHPIIIRESTPEETLEILKGLRNYYETHHQVEITDEALEAAVKLSTRYMTDRFLPDKAIDLIDETSAFHKMISGKGSNRSSLKKIERELSELSDQKRQAVFERNFIAALEIKNQESKLLKSKQRTVRRKNQSTDLVKIKASHIAETVSRITGIPIASILKKDILKLRNLLPNLKKQIVGQERVLSEIAGAIKRGRAGIASRERPLASFMFLGPTGTGKTYAAKLLAREIFEDEQALIRIDMSELMERHNVARLIGAPAGYVGYEEGGKLTEAVRRKPYAVILFDEAEKAHRDVFNLLLQVLEEGELTDAAGRKVNFRNTIIILTSNVGVSMLNSWARRFGFGEPGESSTLNPESVRGDVMRQLKEHLRPEFLNRIDKILVFDPLKKEHISRIVKLELKKLQEKLAEQKIAASVPSGIIKRLSDLSHDPSQGARLVRKNIQDLIEDKIAEQILNGKIKEGSRIEIKI